MTNNRYKVLFYYSQEDQAYITCVPELPGCMADGETINQALKNTEITVTEWIETAKELGRKIPLPNSQTISSLKSYDVAKYILQKLGSTHAMALEKLTYYCKVWSLVWYGNAIVTDSLQAWKNGPVFPALYNIHSHKKIVSESDITSTQSLSDDDKTFVDMIINAYSDFDGDQLSKMTHHEAPWQKARLGIPVNASSNVEITDESIEQYYGQCALI